MTYSKVIYIKWTFSLRANYVSGIYLYYAKLERKKRCWGWWWRSYRGKEKKLFVPEMAGLFSPYDKLMCPRDGLTRSRKLEATKWASWSRKVDWSWITFLPCYAHFTPHSLVFRRPSVYMWCGRNGEVLSAALAAQTFTFTWRQIRPASPVRSLVVSLF